MQFIDEIEEQYDKVTTGLAHYLEVYDEKHDDWRMDQMNWMMTALRHIRQCFGNIIYPELDRVEGCESLLSKARLEDELLEQVMMVSLLNVHVDEPQHEHKSKVEDLFEIVKRQHRIDTVLLSNFRQFVPERRLQEIDRVLSQKTFENLSSASASLKK